MAIIRDGWKFRSVRSRFKAVVVDGRWKVACRKSGKVVPGEGDGGVKYWADDGRCFAISNGSVYLAEGDLGKVKKEVA